MEEVCWGLIPCSGGAVHQMGGGHVDFVVASYRFSIISDIILDCIISFQVIPYHIIPYHIISYHT